MDHLCSQRGPVLRAQRGPYAQGGGGREGEGEGPLSPAEDDGSGGVYGAFTLPCRRSHCLSEGLGGLGGHCAPAPPCHTFQGRRAQTTQVTPPSSSQSVRAGSTADSNQCTRLYRDKLKFSFSLTHGALRVKG